jgi:DNA-binding winged helix-turn-helix (wHTH) protein/Tol biopolymer transport system component
MKGMKSHRVRFADIEIDVQNLRVTAGGEIRPMEPKCFRLLLFLLENPGRVLPKEEIMGAVWPDAFVSDNSLAQAVTQVRKALGDDPKAPRYIETVPSVGYRFVADFNREIAEDGTPGVVQPLRDAIKERDLGPILIRGKRPGSLWLLAAALVAVALGAIAYIRLSRTSGSDLPEMRVEIATPATDDPRSFALSPDGRQLAYVATADGHSWLWVRHLASTKAQPLTITEGGAAYPFWSPDSRSIGYFSGGKLRRIDADGGSPQIIADAKSGRGGTWNQDGVILFEPFPQSSLLRVPASGGEAVPATRIAAPVASQRFPQFLPDGRHFLVLVESAAGPTGLVATIQLGSLDSMETRALTGADSAGWYMPPDWLLWVRDGSLVARRLNVARAELTGDTFTLANPVFFDNSHARLFSASRTGLVTYRNGNPTEQLRWFDRAGKTIGALAEPDEKDGYNPSNARVSPDGRRVAVHRRVRDRSDLWLMDESRSSRFTFEGAGNPVWSPDGREIAFGADGRGSRYFTAFFKKPADSSRNPEPIVDSLPDISALDDWSPDGRYLLYQSVNSRTGYDLWTAPLGGDRKPRAFLRTKFDEKYGRFSPDSRWVAYTSNESGKSEVYIRAFTDPAAGVGEVRNETGWQVSTEGGLFPAWRHDGKELYWVGPGGRIMAAPIVSKGRALDPGPAIVLFQAPIFGGGLDVNTGGEEFDVSSDGRFLINTVKNSAIDTITLLQNWRPK